MNAIRANIPIVVFAKSSDERDYLRSILSQMSSTVLCFEMESICFDNLVSISPEVILVRSDSQAIVWRFVFALNILEVNTRLIVMSNVLNADTFSIDGSEGMVQLVPCRYELKWLSERLDQVMHLVKPSPGTKACGSLVGKSQALKAINNLLPSLVNTSDPILIEGEVGTGKEKLALMIARRAHDDGLFMKVNCDAIVSVRKGGPPGLGNELYREIYKIFQSEDSIKKPITVLLDRVDRLDKKAQSEILLLWEQDLNLFDRPGNGCSPWVRLIATSEADLDRLVQRNRFRKELYYRLNVIPIQIPPLRERREDIPLLMDHFIIEACARLRRSFLMPTPHLVEQSGAYQWPGNAEELREAMERLAASGDESQVLRQSGFQSLKKNPWQYLYQSTDAEAVRDTLEIQNCLSGMGKVSLKAICEKFVYRTEKNLLRKALESTNWNRKKAAALLNISYKSMLNKMKMYEII